MLYPLEVRYEVGSQCPWVLPVACLCVMWPVTQVLVWGHSLGPLWASPTPNPHLPTFKWVPNPHSLSHAAAGGPEPQDNGILTPACHSI